MSRKPPDWYKGTISGDVRTYDGTVPPEVEGAPQGEAGNQAVDAPQAVLSDRDKEIAEVRETLEGLIKDRAYTGFHIILHHQDPDTDDESWEAITMGMTLKDLVFAAANMSSRIQELMAHSHETPEKP